VDDVLEHLTILAFQLLGTAISTKEPLMNAGLDSLAGTQFVQAATEHFCSEFPSTLIFDHPTLRAVADSFHL